MKLHKLEEKDNVMENLYAMFHIREAVGRLEMFFKIRVLKNLANFTKKILLQSLLNKVAGLKRSETLLKRDSSTGIFYEIGEIFKNAFFYRTHLVAASETQKSF